MPYNLYVSAAPEDKILIWSMDPDTGALELLEEVPLAGGPSPLACDPAQRFLYVGLRASHQLAALSIEPKTGSLSLLGTIPLESDPCYLSVDGTGRYLLSAYYGAGLVAMHAIGEEGLLRSPPVVWRATMPKAHCIQTDRSNRYAYLPHVGESNRILQYLFDADRGRLTPNAVPAVVPEAGLGPRHYCYHPTLDTVYFDNEQGSSVTAYALDPDTGTLSPFQTLPTLPDGFEGQNTCAQIHMTPDGRYLYAANRGHNSLACFAVDGTTGRLTSLGQQPSEPTPRTFGIDPQGRFLYAAGQGSGRLAAYRIASDGALQPLATYDVGKRPMWVMILEM